MSQQRKTQNSKVKKLVKPKPKIKKKVKAEPADKPLLIIILCIALVGLLFVFSAGAPEAGVTFNNSAYFLIRHSVFLTLGFILLFCFSKINYQKLKDLAMPLSIVVLLLVVATYIPSMGKLNYGATRWLVIGGIPFQPSELAKLATILIISSTMVDIKHLISKNFMICCSLVGLTALLILKQPNLSMFIMIALTSGALMLVGGVSPLLIFSTAGLGSAFVSIYMRSNEYQWDRIKGWLNPWEFAHTLGYNLIQSWYAIGSGGFFGVGYGNSKQKLFWLPFAHTDFIFAVIAEELGLGGSLIVIGLFVAFIYRGFFIANRCPEMFGKLVAFGITFSIGVQAFINVGVATGTLPATGVTLPLISYGGSSVLTTMIMLGILLNISRLKSSVKVSKNGK